MNKFILLPAVLIFSISLGHGQINVSTDDSLSYNTADLNDGPYVFIENDTMIEKRIVNGAVLTKRLSPDTYQTVFAPDQAAFENIDPIAVLSDIHGQYDLVVELLTNNGIIHADLNWSFGEGHLVIVGDVFDRGDKVNETLWLIFDLEQQAKQNGGGVHFVLGNHEYMVLHNDLRYVHEKYAATCALLNLDYPELYGNNTVMGKWLRSKPTIIRINNNVFVHGGLSKEFLDNNDIPIEEINLIMRRSIDRSKEEMKSTDHYKIYFGKNGPIWYRGYFYDDLENRKVVDILDRTKTEHIVVGHCSNETIVQLFNHKIYGVDSSIKKGKYGELLMIEGNEYDRRTLKGKKKKVKQYRHDEENE